MDAAEEPRRPWWRKKRWRLALAAWLLLPPLYVLSYGPVVYCLSREWIDQGAYGPAVGEIYSPLYTACAKWPALDEVSVWWENWWIELAIRHSGEE